MNEKSPHLLVVDDEVNMRHMLSTMLGKKGYVVETAEDGSQALSMLKADAMPFDFILCDIKMPNMDGLEFLEKARGISPDSTVIMMSAYGTLETAIEAMKLGAYDYISKPFKADEVFLTLQKALEREKLKTENVRLRQQLDKLQDKYTHGNMVAKSKAMQSVIQMITKVAGYDTTVLITGESGTGKELVARSIHFNSPRLKNPLIPINCGGIPENLLESELFGHVKGAFTGADKNKIGLCEIAHQGTLFLDEIGELPPALQVKLLRLLQNSEIRPVGASETRKIDIRIVAATAKDLEAEVAAGNFREDLFYRLNVLNIKLPPLRNRTDDIPYLCQWFIDSFNHKLDKAIEGISPPAMAMLMDHAWQGNVRELENVIERAVVLAEGGQITPNELPSGFGKPAPAAGGIGDNVLDEQGQFDGFSLKEAKKIFEKKLIEKALAETGGNRTRASQLLEISHPSLLSKIKEYQIEG
ncbi:MAG: sigma-54 dependent transcriptional regulator [Thermodesulfobacteriota bacterium]|nr:sigma-54 dependent transcriptional regulator [Thermodesulfobacteriota bacterium]